MAYPTVSDYINSLSHLHTIEDYQTTVSEIHDTEAEEQLARARAYNEALLSRNTQISDLTEEDMAEYQTILDVSETGILGYIDIPKIDVFLPIYHGTTEEVLQVGAGHLAGSSFPVGGKGSHAIITGHCGLPSSKLFTDLDELEEGDTFTVTVLREDFTYEVDQILVVEPIEVESLKIDPNQDYCTLVTCTPYGINSHRLLVRGHRVETPVVETVDEQQPEENREDITAQQRQKLVKPFIILVCLVIVALADIVCLVVVLSKQHSHRPKGRHSTPVVGKHEKRRDT